MSSPPKTSEGLLVIYMLVVLYAACFQMQSPAEPFLVEKLVGNETNGEWESAYGRLNSFFSFWQFVGSLIFGLLLDRIGVRAVFAINFLSAALGYYLLSITTTLSGLYLAKVPGIALCGFLCAQTAVCKLTEAGGAARLQALGRLTTSYTIGGVVGPYLGGLLSASYGMLFSAKVAAVGSLLAAALVSLLPAAVDEGGDEKQKQKQKEKENTGAEGSSTASRVAGVLQLVWVLLFVRVFTSISNSMSRSAQPLILKNLGCDVAMLGLVKSLQMGFGGFANAFLLQPLKQLLSSGGAHEERVVPRTLWAICALFALQALLFAPDLGLLESLAAAAAAGTTGGGSAAAAARLGGYTFVVLALAKAIFTFTLMNFLAVRISAAVPKDLQGTLMGMQHALFAVAHVMGPTAGVTLLTDHGIAGLSLSCATIYVAVLGVFWACTTATDASAADPGKQQKKKKQ